MAAATRSELCKSTAQRIAQANPAAVNAVIGFDGFVDEIIEVVAKRHTAMSYDRLRTIGEFGTRITAAAGQSSNYELVVAQQKLGGNGPIMANALAAIGLSVTYIGNLGYPEVHPVFRELAGRSRVISIGEACHTDALEFDDGKLMLGKLTPTTEINWDNVVTRVGRDRLTDIVSAAQLIGTVNWTMLPFMNEIWSHMLNEIILQTPARSRLLFVDLADPEKRTREDLKSALVMLEQMQEHLGVVLGLNLKEAVQVAGVLGLPAGGEKDHDIENLAAGIQKHLKLQTVVIHPRFGAAAASAEGCAWFAGPFVKQPRISTGAGDHFNAGFIAGQVLGLTQAESLCMGTATSGFYVRTGISPSAAQLQEFITELPPPQAG